MLRRRWRVLLVVSLLVAFATPASAVPKTGSWAIDVVQPGDTLSAIANCHGTTWQRLMQLNGLTRPDIVPGQALIVPRSSLTVRAGDTLWELAVRHGTTTGALRRANGLCSDSILTPGTRLRIPQDARIPIDAGLFFVPTGNAAKDRALMARYRSTVRRVGLFDVRITKTAPLPCAPLGPQLLSCGSRGNCPTPSSPI